MDATEPTIRSTTTSDLDAISQIYAHYVLTGVATFEETPPASSPGRRAVVVDADADASLALHRNRGFVDAGRLTLVGFKHGRWLDTLLLQRSLS